MPRIICYLTVVLLFFSIDAAAAEIEIRRPADKETGSISGRMVGRDNKYLAGGRASFFAAEIGPPSNYGNLRRIPEAMAPIGPNGEFTVRLPAGRYYLGAMSRDLLLGPGPPRPGEEVLAAMDEEKNKLIIEVVSGRETHLGSIVMMPPRHGPEPSDYFRVTGAVSDDEGNPFGRAVIFVKTDPRSKRPVFISLETGSDGRFDFKLPANRSYYLVAKEILSTGRPSSGQLMGTYNGPDGVLSVMPVPAPIFGKKGEVVDEIDIIMRRISDPGPPKEADPDNDPEAQGSSAVPRGE